MDASASNCVASTRSGGATEIPHQPLGSERAESRQPRRGRARQIAPPPPGGEPQNPARPELDDVAPASNIDPMAIDVAAELPARAAPGARSPEDALPLLLDAAEAARLLGVGRTTFYQFDLTGLVPRPVRLSKIRRWSRPELHRWVEAGCPPRSRWERAR